VPSPCSCRRQGFLRWGKPIAESESTQKIGLEGASRFLLLHNPLMLEAVGNPVVPCVPPLGTGVGHAYNVWAMPCVLARFMNRLFETAKLG
jgi:hypothetical protein